MAGFRAPRIDFPLFPSPAFLFIGCIDQAVAPNLHVTSLAASSEMKIQLSQQYEQNSKIHSVLF